MQDTPERHAQAMVKPPAATKPETLQLDINGKPYFHDGEPELPLLWFLRDTLRLTGTKYGCDGGAGCRACLVLIDGKATAACQTPVRAAAGHKVVTIEGLESDRLHPVQQAWIDEDAIQCGYCQSAQIIATVDLLMRNRRPGDEDIARVAALCRCGSYPSVRRAVQRAAQLLHGEPR